MGKIQIQVILAEVPRIEGCDPKGGHGDVFR